ncbi:XrtA/PEP-CTERM system TPR-repeat protein PrsT [Methylococcus sp. EFPC2]|uniref:XrtA/PEP-CTERM system TPR-repeat protein PrsT n=1 Tax=Methylococcus sp. EFPC2 TaxID=2812648 RepID=UPI00196713B2|nr:XrtA/PEP-CTERM system TPR-repeat protein PrsT [Methylococcus sp. EFPC2]QSA95694.1 PEP-CTERM system TPR-repeat protein PrsT [Methylococcus sp. EFPC2]
MQKKLFRKYNSAAAIACFIGITITSCDKYLTDTEHLAKAKESLDAGDLRTGVIELKGALQKNPDNAEARRLLGEIDVTLGNGGDAEKELRRALELGVAKEAILVPLAEALQLENKHQQILDEITIPPTFSATDGAKLTAYRGDAWLALGKPQQASTEYHQALSIDANSAFAKLGLSRIALAENRIDDALKLATEAVESAPNEARAWSLQAELYRAKSDFPKAEDSYTKAIERRTLNQLDRANRAIVRVDLKKLDLAKEDIEILKKQAQNLFLTHFADGALAYAQNKFAEAQGAFEQSLKLNDKYAQTHYFLSLSHLMQNHLAQAEDEINRYLSIIPRSVNGYKLLATIKYRLNDPEGAKRTLQPVLAQFPDDIATLRLIGNIELAQGNETKGIEYLEKAVNLNPNTADSHIDLGMGLMRSGNQEKSSKEFEAAIQIDPQSPQPAILLALSQISAKEYAKAGETIQALKERLPKSPGPWNLEGLSHLGQGQQTHAEQAFKQALTLEPGNSMASDRLAQLALKDKRFDVARNYYQEALHAHPNDLDIQLRLAQLDSLEGKPSDMEAKLTQIVQDHPDVLPPRILLARHYLRFGQPRRSQTLLVEVRPRYPDSQDLLATLTEAQLEDNLATQALETAKALAKEAPQSAAAHLLLAAAYENNRDAKGMRTALMRSLTLDPKLFRSRIAMVRLLVQEQKNAEAEKQLTALVNDEPENADVLSLQGWYLTVLQNRPKDAITPYQKAFEKAPSTSAVTKLAQTQWLAGDRDRALATLEQWNKQHPNDAFIHYARSNLYTQLGKDKAAIEQLEQTIKIDPNYILALNDLAWLLRKSEPTKALEYAEEAVAKAPKSPRLMDTLAMVLIEKSQADRALSVIQEAAALAPSNPLIRYHLAIAQEKKGAKEDALNTLNDLLSRKDDFDERKEAEALLTKLKKR